MAQNDDMLDGDDKPSKGKAPAPAPKKKGGLLLVLVGVVVLVAAPAASYFLFFKKGGDAKEAPQKPAPPPVVMAVEPVVVNISGTRMTRVLRMQVHLVLSQATLEPVVKEMLPMVKDRIIAVAGRRTLNELETVEDRDSLKRDLVLEINGLIRPRMAGTILDVAFSEFLIQ